MVVTNKATPLNFKYIAEANVNKILSSLSNSKAKNKDDLTTINHSVPLSKLLELKLSVNELNWIQSFLLDCSQSVRIKDKTSILSLRYGSAARFHLRTTVVQCIHQ